MKTTASWIGLALVATLSLPVHGAVEEVEYIHTDALGTPIVVTDENGDVIERFEYEPYGLQISGPVENGPGYTGHVEDATTGLTYMQQRYYDPGIGMFLSVDPVTAYSNPVGQFNRYRYANGNPYRYTDPDGRVIDTIWDAANVVYDLGKAGYGAATGNDALVQEGLADAAIDSAAMLVPFVPAGITKIGRAATKAVSDAVDAGKSAGRAKNKLGPVQDAEGAHSSFKHGADGKVSNYAEYTPNSNNPSGFQEVKRVDVTGKAHTNPDGTVVPTPHVKEAGQKGVRPATTEELPRP